MGNTVENFTDALEVLSRYRGCFWADYIRSIMDSHIPELISIGDGTFRGYRDAVRHLKWLKSSYREVVKWGMYNDEITSVFKFLLTIEPNESYLTECS